MATATVSKTRKVGSGRSPESGRTTGVTQAGRARMSEIQRARLLAAVADVGAERGAGNLTVAQVVSRAGVSRRTFYEYFADCEDCFLAALDDVIGRVEEFVLRSYDPGAAWLDRVRAALTAILTFVSSDRNAGYLLVVGSLSAGPGAQERRSRVLALMARVVDEGRQAAKDGARLPPLTAEGVVGGAVSVLHARILTERPPDVELVGPLMSMIVLPYLGVAAARRELARPVRSAPSLPPSMEGRLIAGLQMRLTYRTVRVLMAVAGNPGSSNRRLATAAEVTDQGQMSRLLARLQSLGLIENGGGGSTRGEANAWRLTDTGRRVQSALAERSDGEGTTPLPAL